jgi:23S rRNA pseudouridine2604 synthase
VSGDQEKIRLSKLMSQQGLCSRREADDYIARGLVFVDGVKVTELGTKIFASQQIKLGHGAKVQQASRVTFLLHKPVGYVSAQPEKGHKAAVSLIASDSRFQGDDSGLPFDPSQLFGLAPAGRLDIDSQGLLVLTQDGRIAKQLIGADSEIEKEYLVRVQGRLNAADLQKLNFGLSLDGEALKHAKVDWQNADQLRFILKEGKKRQIRRMCELVGLKVVGLKRVRIGKVKLGDLPPGQWRYLREDEAF